MNIKEIKELSIKFSLQQIEKCIDEALKNGRPLTEGCNPSGDIIEILNTLAKAQTVRELMEQGMSQVEAIREIAKKIREFQSVT
ncbi:MAG: YoaH family protein [Hydrogenothermaceae bacterium]|nr:YoaH family protein [Hydrogenothermaceae bacterium]